MMYLRMVPDLEVEGGARNPRLGGGGRAIVSRVLVGEPRRPEFARAG
jgi:hypothetical protein